MISQSLCNVISKGYPGLVIFETATRSMMVFLPIYKLNNVVVIFIKFWN